MENLIVIVAVIWALLSIILFFKLWNATNNVERIKDFILKQNIEKAPRFLYATNQIEELYLQLNIHVFTDLHLAAVQVSRKYNDTVMPEAEANFNEERGDILSTYQKSYKEINKEIPQHFFNVTLLQMLNINLISTDYGV